MGPDSLAPASAATAAAAEPLTPAITTAIAPAASEPAAASFATAAKPASAEPAAEPATVATATAIPSSPAVTAVAASSGCKRGTWQASVCKLLRWRRQCLHADSCAVCG